MREVVPSMKGGAVKEERSPLNEATDYQAVSKDVKKIHQMSNNVRRIDVL